MNNVTISLYKKINNISSKDVIPLDLFLENIRDGYWQDKVLKVRCIKDKEEYEQAKTTLPLVTISGKFKERTDKGIERHSGYIGIDIDDCDAEEAKDMIKDDHYIVAAFTSVSGNGLCIIFKIIADKHREAFQGIGEYLFTNYGLISDPTSINPSRARFVSFDPHLIWNNTFDVFKEYPKTKPPKKIDKIVYSTEDFSHLLSQITEKQINICEDYYTWLRIGFAFTHKFGESGRPFFHSVSQYSSKYDPDKTDKQYDACIRHIPTNKETTIAAFYYYCKEAGLEIYSEKTLRIAHTAIQGKKGGLNAIQVAENLHRFEEMEIDDSVKSIIEQVFNNNIEIAEGSLIDQLKLWLRQNYEIERNIITRRLETNGKSLDNRQMNSIWVRSRSIFEKLPYDDLKRTINSDLFPEYNPFIRFFSEYSNVDSDTSSKFDFASGPLLSPQEIVAKLKTEAPLSVKLFSLLKGNTDEDYNIYFGTKWLVGLISCMHYQYSSLCLVLTGSKVNTGKTEWFRRLLPREWHDWEGGRLYPDYYAESELDKGKDDDILMTQKILIMDDEFGGKSKRDSKTFKKLTSKQMFSLREPYGEANVDMIRIAGLGGTSNDDEIISDPVTNRRIIPIHVLQKIDHASYNAIDKRLLFLEAYSLWKRGLKWRLEEYDIIYLENYSKEYQSTVLEEELIQKFFNPGSTAMMASEIKVYIEQKTGQRLLLDKISKYLTKLGFERKSVYKSELGAPRRCYMVDRIIELGDIGKHDRSESIPTNRDEPDIEEKKDEKSSKKKDRDLPF